MSKKLVSVATKCIALTLAAMLVVFLLPQPAYADPGWLSGWAKRVKITIDKDDIGENLTHFPVLIHLSSACGIGDAYDLTFVFDEVGANSKRIAVTRADGTTQLYVEIEKWDVGAEEAWLWVSKSDWTILSTTDTDIYLYYDNSQGDNTTYVGDSGSSVAQNVWDDNFKAVWHLTEETGGTDAFKDSTSNANHGTDGGSPTFGAPGKIDNAIEFNGTDAYIGCGTSQLGLNGANNATLEAWFNADTLPSGCHTIACRDEYVYPFHIHTYGTSLRCITRTTDTNYDISQTISATTWYYFAVRIHIVATGDDWDAYLDTTNWSGTFSNSGSLDSSSGDPISIGGDTGGDWFDGIVDEVRVSNVDRGAEWIKASYETQRDHLLDYFVPTWDSYSDSGHSTQCDYFDDYPSEHNVYMYGSGFATSTQYRVVFWDGAGDKAQTEDPTSDEDGNLEAAYEFAAGDTDGNWQCAVYDSTSYSPSSYDPDDSHIVADDTSRDPGDYAFYMEPEAIPEFPTVIAGIAVAGLCFGIYYWMRRRLKLKVQSAKEI